VELVEMGVDSFKMETSLFKVELLKLGWILMEETEEVTPPELRFCQ
jgi:hypothetical protein